MRKVIAAINMTLDGFCDHTAMIADGDLHQHYTNLLESSGVILYGRTTFQLMQYWQDLRVNPSADKYMNDFAVAIDSIPKIVFSSTLKNTQWDSARLADQPIEKLVMELKQLSGKDILIGSPSLILTLTQLCLIDEYQLCVHPVLAADGLPLFKGINGKRILKLFKTKTFGSGAILLYYKSLK